MPETNKVTDSLSIAKTDLTPWTGVALRVGDLQIALFSYPDVEPYYFALDQYDPIGEANVLARGILGSVKGEPVVASPLYKQHFNLRTGVCLEQPEVQIATYPLLVTEQFVTLQL